jgi:protein gp37
MGIETKIQWAHHTFNPWRGCSKVHTGCANCYAEKESKRFPKNRGVWGPAGTRVRASDAMWAEPVKWNAAAAAAGERHRVFCASLADVFEQWAGDIYDHEGNRLWIERRHSDLGYIRESPCYDFSACRPAVMGDLRRDLFALIDRTPWLDWLILTKRPDWIGACWSPVIRPDADGEISDHVDPRRENVWLLTSVSDQETFEVYHRHLLEWRELVPVLGISVEPMLGPINFEFDEIAIAQEPDGQGNVALAGGLDWIIFGGESGPKARPCNLAWLRYGIDQCQYAGVAAFVKQAGAYPLVPYYVDDFRDWALARPHLVKQAVAGGFVNWSHADFGQPSPGSLIEVHLNDPKGGDLAELPEELHVREFPAPALKAVSA